jgi:hypothetical protein
VPQQLSIAPDGFPRPRDSADEDGKDHSGENVIAPVDDETHCQATGDNGPGRVRMSGFKTANVEGGPAEV